VKRLSVVTSSALSEAVVSFSPKNSNPLLRTKPSRQSSASLRSLAASSPSDARLSHNRGKKDSPAMRNLMKFSSTGERATSASLAAA